MKYNKTVWKDRVVENPRTFNVKNNADNTMTLTPSEGQIVEPGTPIIAKNMNNLEDKVEELADKHIIISAEEPEGHYEGRVWIQIT
ncbi:MAG: hypothetical protein ACRCVJ_12460 [Clostridium sp.]|uniref:hypothetical protein n=1 Tax=Clostridium sp. TaxID=1506 RepID=UPI003F2A3903